jgi:hypothetical protein
MTSLDEPQEIAEVTIRVGHHGGDAQPVVDFFHMVILTG